MNFWLKLVAARKIAAELQIKFCGASYNDESEMIEHLFSHPDFDDDDMWLNVNWDDFECVGWIQIGVGNQLVPR